MNRLLADLVGDLRFSIVTRFESSVCAPGLACRQLRMVESRRKSYVRGEYDCCRQRKRGRSNYVRRPSVARAQV
jgi:hypothetical protein